MAYNDQSSYSNTEYIPSFLPQAAVNSYISSLNNEQSFNSDAQYIPSFLPQAAVNQYLSSLSNQNGDVWNDQMSSYSNNMNQGQGGMINPNLGYDFGSNQMAGSGAGVYNSEW